MSAAAPVIVTVTLEDIKEGEHLSCQACPIALAANRAFPGRTAVVGLRAISLYGSVWVAHYELPGEAQDWIRDYENRKRVWPTCFMLENPTYERAYSAAL